MVQVNNRQEGGKGKQYCGELLHMAVYKQWLA